MSKPSEPAERPRRRSIKSDAPLLTPAAASNSAPSAQADAAPPPRGGVKPEERRSRIAVFAYLRAERRGFQPGFEVEDWLIAEQEVDRSLMQASGSSQS